MRLQIIGGGKMGEALLGGLLQKMWADPADLVVIEAVPARRAELTAGFPGVGVHDTIVPGVDAIVAVKPDAVEGVCRALGAAGVGRVLSIAAGVTIARLERSLATSAAVVRAMPNTPSLVGLGGYTSILTGQGTRIAEDRVGITSGNAMTVAVGVQALLGAANEHGIDLATANFEQIAVTATSP